MSLRTRMTLMVRPNHTNTSGAALGGWLLKQLDICAFNAAQRHHRGAAPPVTVSIDSVNFEGAVHAGQVLTVDAAVTRTFGKSLEVEVTMRGEDPAQPAWGTWPVLRSYATFVAMGSDGRAAKVAEFSPNTEREHASFLAAGARRAGRLERLGEAAVVPPKAEEMESDTDTDNEHDARPGNDHGDDNGEDSTADSWASSCGPAYRSASARVEMTESVFSRHTNARGTAFGGQLRKASITHSPEPQPHRTHKLDVSVPRAAPVICPTYTSLPQCLVLRLLTRFQSCSPFPLPRHRLPSFPHSYSSYSPTTSVAWGGAACTISAMRYAGMGGLILAASDEVAFLRPVMHGDTVVIHADVTAPWRRSLEVGLTIEREDPTTGDREHCLSAYFTYVLPTDSAGRRLELQPRPNGDPYYTQLAVGSQGQMEAVARRERRLAAAAAQQG